MLTDQIRNDFQTALKEKNETVKSVLRLTLSVLKNKEIDKKEALTDEEVVSVLQKEVKKRKESIEAFTQGNRPELVQKEREELTVLDKYLPQEMGMEELGKIVRETIDQVETEGTKDFGKIMRAMMGKVKGRIGGDKVAEEVKKALA